MPITRIACDLDGVIVDLNTALNAESGDAAAKIPDGQMYSSSPDDEKLFQQAMHRDDFWQSLKVYAEAGSFVTDLQDLAPTFFLSRALPAPSCWAGKQAWASYHFPWIPLFLTGAKKACIATPEILLVDDSDGEVDAWRKAGGRAVLFPRRWNSDHQQYAVLQADPRQLYLHVLNNVIKEVAR